MPAATEKTRADARVTTLIMNPLLDSVSETFEMMFESQASRNALAPRAEDASPADLSAVISISGPAKGTICLGFPNGTALKAAEALTGEKQTRVNDEVADAVGELANIVAGGAKSKIEMGLNLGLPKVFAGGRGQIEFPSGAHPLRLNYDSDLGHFVVDFGFVSRGNF